jgi:hypothetical protein
MQSCRFLAIVTAVGLAACTGTGQPNSPASDFAHYRSLPNYRAMAVSGGVLTDPSYASGWSSAATSIDDAIEVAMRECQARRQPSTHPPCELYALGNLVVAGADAATLARAECIYILDPTATSLTGPYADACGMVARRAVPAMAGSGAKLNASEIASGIIANTLAVDGAAFIFLAPDGSARLRSADPVYGPDQGSWRLRPDGALCLQWQRARAGQERCHELSQNGTAYALGDLPFTVIDGNPFRL